MTTTMEPKSATGTMQANGLAAARQATDEAAARTRGWVQNSLKPAAEGFSKAGNEAVQSGRGNLEAVAQSTQAYLTGMQDLSRQYATAMQGLTRHALEDARAFAGARSLEAVMAAQASFTRGFIERALGEGTKLQRTALTLTQQVYAPLTRRATVVLEQMKPSHGA